MAANVLSNGYYTYRMTHDNPMFVNCENILVNVLSHIAFFISLKSEALKFYDTIPDQKHHTYCQMAFHLLISSTLSSL